MAKIVAVYKKPEDLELWDWVQAYAKSHRMTLTSTIIFMIESFKKLKEEQNVNK